MVALVSVAEYHDKFRLLLDARRFAAMYPEGDKLDFIDACYGGRHNTALGA